MTDALDLSRHPLSAKARPRLTHIAELDGVRGIAILLVLLTHSMLFWDPFPFPAVGRGIHFLQTGVDLFFVLSGFLITCILLDTRGCRRYLPNFILRRSLRIWPLYFAVLVGITVVLGPVALREQVRDYHLWRSGWIWNYLFGTNIFLAKTGKWTCAVTDVTWSVCVEEQFYILWPIVVLIFSRRPLAILSAAMIVAAAGTRLWVTRHFGDPWFVSYMLPVTRMDALGIGALVACVFGPPRRDRPALLGRRGSALCTMAAVALLTGAALMRGNFYIVVGFTFIGAGYGVFLLVALHSEPGLVRRWLSWRPLRYLGKISYGLYLTHLIVGYSVRALLWRLGVKEAPAFFVGTAAMIVLSVCVASLSWWLFERPILSLTRFFPRPGPNKLQRPEHSFVNASMAVSAQS